MLLRVRLEGGTVCEWCVCSEKAVTNTLRTKGQLLGTQAYTRREARDRISQTNPRCIGSVALPPSRQL